MKNKDGGEGGGGAYLLSSFKKGGLFREGGFNGGFTAVEKSKEMPKA